MIDRRSSGIASLHTLLLAAEISVWWLGLRFVFQHTAGLTYTTLLPTATYPVAVALAIIVAMGPLWRLDGNLASLGWAGSMRLSFRQTVAVTGAIFTIAVGLKDPGISRIFLAAYVPSVGFLLVVLNRYQPGVLVRFLFEGGSRLPTLILGDSELFPRFEEWLSLREKLGLDPAGIVAYHGKAPTVPGLEIVGEFADLKAAIQRTGARQVLMLSLPHNPADAEHLAKVCASCGCRLLIHNNLTFRLNYPLRVLSQDGYSFLAFQDEPLEDPLNRCLKRGLDIAVAVPAVLLVVPIVGVITWVMQRRQAPGPLFYRQVRSGRAGGTFHILKFRTMYAAAESGDRQTARMDDRVFPFGRLLRRTSLDELPQFLNVLRGDMSVVGPRPHFVPHDEVFAGAVNEYRVRYFVKPGITGLAQSRGLRGEMRTAEAVNQRIQLDLYYIHSWSVWLDLAIIARTTRQLILPPPSAQ
jgi:exopolysaccharide biosynthesis polyprenyl glycosylphosphotransferase